VEQFDDRFFLLIVSSSDFIVGRQLELFHNLIVLAFYDFDNDKMLLSLCMSITR
jgi:hypothetical protein